MVMGELINFEFKRILKQLSIVVRKFFVLVISVISMLQRTRWAHHALYGNRLRHVTIICCFGIDVIEICFIGIDVTVVLLIGIGHFVGIVYSPGIELFFSRVVTHFVWVEHLLAFSKEHMIGIIHPFIVEHLICNRNQQGKS